MELEWSPENVRVAAPKTQDQELKVSIFLLFFALLIATNLPFPFIRFGIVEIEALEISAPKIQDQEVRLVFSFCFFALLITTNLLFLSIKFGMVS